MACWLTGKNIPDFSEIEGLKGLIQVFFVDTAIVLVIPPAYEVCQGVYSFCLSVRTSVRATVQC